MNRTSPLLTVDVVLVFPRGTELQVALAPRLAESEPFYGRHALPGGWVRPDEDADTQATAERVLWQKLGVRARYLEQLGTFSGASRDPRGWSASVVYLMLSDGQGLPEDLKAVPLNAPGALPFDHAQIVEAAAQRLRHKAQYSLAQAALLEQPFTLGQLQQMTERVMGAPVDRHSFRRHVAGFSSLVPLNEQTQGGRHRPAALYRVEGNLAQTFASKNLSAGA